jgi:hypothetical protein
MLDENFQLLQEEGSGSPLVARLGVDADCLLALRC